MKLKTEVVSIIQTIVTVFAIELGVALSNLPDGTLGDPTFWKAGGAAALILGVGRTVVKVVWRKFLPVSIGGVRD